MSIRPGAPILHVVAGVLRDARGHVLIAQRPAGKHLAGGWEFPGGKLQPGESAEAGLRRELLEEIGVEVRRAEPLARYSHEYPDRVVLLDVWSVTDYAGTPSGLEGQPLRWSPVEELLEAGLLPADRPIVEALLADR